MGVPLGPEAGGRRWGPVLLAVFLAASRGLVAAFKVATPYSLYVCSEGQNVTLTCKIMGPMAKGHDVTYYKTWYRSSRGEVQVCSERRPIRNLTFQDLHLHHSGHQANTSQDLAQRYGLESVSDHHGNFSITMRNLTSMDSGLYCCLVVEIRHHHSEQRVYGAMELQVHTDKEASFQCISYPPSPKESESITAAALATGACIVGILCLPLILLLVYKQRQVATNRRAQELVRMDRAQHTGMASQVLCARGQLSGRRALQEGPYTATKPSHLCCLPSATEAYTSVRVGCSPCHSSPSGLSSVAAQMSQAPTFRPQCLLAWGCGVRGRTVKHAKEDSTPGAVVPLCRALQGESHQATRAEQQHARNRKPWL
uniref:Ig-like domain-containing protein n=1 Tax=Canis lupus familiaris TaxID=9615 RepID=A0A8C0PX68_CANLF